ncbi:MAG TPA: HEAT repeat domain-containing protein [Pyrinomonadaceae bacterium]|nr:HEAT repeat domain-containing protein [Pyrinomonadaceae bacterium]
MKNTIRKIQEAASGRATLRGLLLIAFVIAAFESALAQYPAELTPENAARLKRQIDSGSSEEKRSALLDIRNLQSPTASAIAVPALQDTDVLVRSTAASSVVYLPKADAARVLLPLLNDRDEFVRREAAHALGDVGDESATSALVRVMERDKVLEVRSSAALALGKIGDVNAVENLLKILRSKPSEDFEFLRRNAARSIGQIAQIVVAGERAVVTPQNYLPEKFRDFGRAGMNAPPGFSSAVDGLIAVLRNASEADDTRREAAFALGAIGDTRAISALQAQASSADPYMVEIVREALLKIERRNKPAGT